MKVFLIGGVSVGDSDPDYAKQRSTLDRSMAALGCAVAGAGHDLLVCSPFDGSADIAAAADALSTARNSRFGSTVEFHHPDAAEIVAQMDAFRKRFTTDENLKSFQHPTPRDERGNTAFEYAWLLSQTYAMDRSHGVIALGGRMGKSASLLLGLLDVRKKPLLPLTFLGGAASQAFERRRYLLEDRLGSDIAALHDPRRSGEVVDLLVAASSDRSLPSPISKPQKFFLSYPRARPHEADFVETSLRRRQLDVFRDERDFAPGTLITSAIETAIHASTVFIAIWCKEYACSDWCFDELTMALQRQEEGKLTVWLFCVDETRIVPPGARTLTNYPARSREELERHILILLERCGRSAAK